MISVVGNVAPREMRELLVLFEAQKTQEAALLHQRLMPLMKGLFLESNPGPVKFLLSDWGLIQNELRLPLVPVEKETENKIRASARESGIRSPKVDSGAGVY